MILKVIWFLGWCCELVFFMFTFYLCMFILENLDINVVKDLILFIDKFENSKNIIMYRFKFYKSINYSIFVIKIKLYVF